MVNSSVRCCCHRRHRHQFISTIFTPQNRCPRPHSHHHIQHETFSLYNCSRSSFENSWCILCACVWVCTQQNTTIYRVVINKSIVLAFRERKLKCEFMQWSANIWITYKHTHTYKYTSIYAAFHTISLNIMNSKWSKSWPSHKQSFYTSVVQGGSSPPPIPRNTQKAAPLLFHCYSMCME